MLVIATIITGRIVRPIARLSDATRQVALGDLTHKIESGEANEIGDLALSFGEMVAGLRNAAGEQASQDWFKTGHTGISQQMRGEDELALLARNVVTYLAKYLNAQVGAFYVPNDDQCLKLMGSYAYPRRVSDK